LIHSNQFHKLVTHDVCKINYEHTGLENLLRLLKICKINIVNSKCTQNLTENLKSLTESHSATSVASATIQMEPNYLDPILFRSNNRVLDFLIANGIRRLSSVGRSSHLQPLVTRLQDL